MTVQKRIISGFMALLMVFGCFFSFVACQPSGSSEVEIGSSEEEIAEPIVLSSNGKSEYIVVRSLSASMDFVAVCKSLVSYLNKTLGAGVSAKDDWVEQGVDVDQLYEIVIGGANRKECRELIDRTALDGYAIEVIGKKIVIAAHNDELISEAIEQFKSMLEKNENGDIILKANRAEKKGTCFKFFGKDRPLSDYRIVYKKGASDSAAQLLASKIKHTCKLELPVVSDDTEKSEFEILVGHTNRGVDELPKANQKDIAEYGYYFTVSGNALKIYGGIDSDWSTQKAMERFVDAYVNARKANIVTVPSDLKPVGLEGLESISPDRHEDANLRILSFNILSQEWNDCLPTETRDTEIMATILTLSPDVAGIQEVSTKWYSVLEQGIGSTYAFVGKEVPGGSDNYTALIYNRERVELIESGMVKYSVGNLPRARVFNWGLFESKATGRRFIAANTHYDANSTYVHTKERILQATEMAQAVNELRAKYNVPVFCCGDYNSYESGEAFRTFLELSGFKDPKYSAKTIINPTKTWHKVGSLVSPDPDEGIDHITCSPDADVVLYNTLIDRYWVNTSDHCPIYIDVKLQ